MKKFLLTLCFVFFFCSITYASELNLIFSFLEKRYPNKFVILSKVEEIAQDQIILQKTPFLEPGDELLVVEKKEGMSFYLYPKKSIIKVRSMFGNKALAYVVYKIKNITPEDLVVKPFAPTIFLYSNIKERDSFPPYQKLLQELLKRGYEVKEIYYKDKIKPTPRSYGLLLRLEGLTDHLLYKIQSIYTQDTMFSITKKTTYSFVTEVPAGKSLFESASASKKEDELAYPIVASSFTTSHSFKKASTRPSPRRIRLGEEYRRLVICDLDGNGTKEFVLLGERGIRAYSFKNGHLFPFAYYTFPQDMYGLHMHTIDINKDGKDDIVVTVGKDEMILEAEDTSLHSMILTYNQRSFRALVRNLPYYLRVIEDRHGNKILLGQKRGDFSPYMGDIVSFIWKGGHLSSSGPYLPAKGVYSLYQFNLLPHEFKRISILEKTGHVSVYFTPSERLEFITDKSYGEYNVIPIKVRLREPKFVKGGFEKTTYQLFYVGRRFCLKREYDDQLFLINKQRKVASGLEKLKTRFLEQDREDSIVALKWDGKILQQTWQSETISKDIIDFAFLSYKGEDKLFVLVMDSQGYAIEELQ